MPRGHRIVWTREMDLLVLSHSTPDAAARLGLSRLAVQARRRALVAAGRTLAVPIAGVDRQAEGRQRPSAR